MIKKIIGIFLGVGCLALLIAASVLILNSEAANKFTTTYNSIIVIIAKLIQTQSSSLVRLPATFQKK